MKHLSFISVISQPCNVHLRVEDREYESVREVEIQPRTSDSKWCVRVCFNLGTFKCIYT